jgi:hypothetical protein
VLSALQASGGWMETPRFARRFGLVRPMGPGRLARECPWEAPANVAEALWYRGLVFRGFRPATDGVVEVFYVPEDLLALLPSPPTPDPFPALAATEAPPHVIGVEADLVEDVFNTLVYVRRRPLQLDAVGELAAHDWQAINALCVQPLPDDQLPATPAAGSRLAFLVYICRAAGLITQHGSRLTVSRDPARAWLQASPDQRLLDLQVAWRDDDDWNDLHHVPTLKLRPTGWRNDPRLARQAVLRVLSACQPLTWYRLSDLVAAIKTGDPDFQRPDGDYSSWYVYDQTDQPLIGFEHWEAVEGALICYLGTHPLHWLGVLDLGGEADDAPVTVCRVSAAGARLINPMTASNGEPLGDAAGATAGEGFSMRDDFLVQVTADASLYDRFQLARFADRVERAGDAVVYRISPRGVNLVGKQGVSAEQINAFLMRVTRQQVPQRVLDAIARWQKSGAARLERALVLHLDSPELLSHMRRDPQVGPWLGEVVGPASVLVSPANEPHVRRWLTEQGYL